MRKSIFIPIFVIFVAIIVFGFKDPASFYKVETAVSTFGYDNFAWLYALVALGNIIILMWLVLSRYGSIILGGKTAKPLMSRWSWFSISLCGGIGTGILFWGIAEPIYHLNNPTPFLNDSVGALATAMFHWGFPAYAHYCVFGLASGYACYNLKLPFRISSVLYPIFGKKSFGLIGDLIDLISVFAIAVAVAAVLAVAAIQLSSGLLYVFDIKPTNLIRAAFLSVIVISFIISSYTGLFKGIRILSGLNTRLFFMLLFFVFVFGASKFSLFFSVEAFGRSMSEFISRITYLGAKDGDKWPMWWTIIYWIWMMVYAPVIGLFLGKIAKGRSVREFIVMNLLVPVAFVILWFGIFGSNAIKIDIQSGSAIWSITKSEGLEASAFAFFHYLPLSTYSSVLFMVVLFLSVVTLGDSITLTIASLSMKNTENPPKIIRIFWGIIISLVAFVSILATSSSIKDAIDMVQSTKLLPMMVGVPVLFIFVGLLYSLVKMFVSKDRLEKEIKA